MSAPPPTKTSKLRKERYTRLVKLSDFNVLRHT
jgi:hypothetical protein